MMFHLKKKLVLSALFAFALLICLALAALPTSSAMAVGPALQVSGATPSALNSSYTDTDTGYNEKAYYLSSDGGSSVYYDGSRWCVKNQYWDYYYSNASNGSLPPSSGWKNMNGTAASISVSYGPSISFADTAVTAHEENESVTLRINISQFSYTSTLTYTCASGTASASDYSGGGTVQLYGTETYVNIYIGITDDDDYESNETFTVTLTGQDGAPITNGTCTITIVSDDPQTAVGVGSTAITEEENAGTVVIPVTLSKTSTTDTSVNYATANGTASSGADYTAASGTLTIPAGETGGNITITLLADDIYEGSETFTLTLSSPANGMLGAQKTATVTLTDNDTQPAVGFASSDAAVVEQDGVISLDVTLSGACQSSVTVNYATADSTAFAGSDYTAKSGTLTIPAGSTTGTIDVTLKDDSYYEGSEAFQVTLTSPAVAVLGTDSTTVTISDSESMPSVGFSAAAVFANESAGKATLTVSLSNQAQGDITVQYATVDGTAKAGSDYTAASDTIRIPGKTSSVTLDIADLNDNVYEWADEAFTVTLSSPVGAKFALDAVTVTATVTVTDNEAVPSVGFTAADFSAEENTGTGVLQVSLSGAVQGQVTMNYATSDLGAKAGVDYTAASGTLTIPEGALSAVVNVTLSGDTIYESDKTFGVTLSNPAMAVMNTNYAVFTITNDDAPPALGFEDSEPVANENDGSALLTVKLIGGTQFDTTVDYATTNGTAKSGADYTPASGTLTIPAGSSEATITIPILQNTVYEAEETFTVTLENPGHATLSNTSANVTIADDEEKPTVDFTTYTASPTEQNGTVTLPVSLSAVCGEDVTVEYATLDGTATEGGDYTAKTGTLTIPAGDLTGSITVSIKDDHWYDGSESFSVSLFAPTFVGLGVGTETITISDDEPMPQAGFDESIVTANENEGMAALLVNLSGKAQRDIAIQYSTADDTAKAGSDYTAVSGTLVIPGDSLSGTVEVPVLDDGLYEGGEAFLVNLSSPTGATISAGQAAVNLTDSESVPVLGFLPDAYTAGEGDGTVALSLALTTPAQADIVVHYVTQDGTAAAPGDFAQTTGTLTIPGGSASASITIPIADDDWYEGEEDFLVVLLDSTIATLGTDTARIDLNDTQIMPSAGFSAASFEASENGGDGALTVMLSGKSQADVTVDYAALGDTAASGTDFAAVSGTLTIPGGQTQGTVLVPLMDDFVYEGDESFTVNLSSPAGATLAAASAAFTIRENEGEPQIGFSGNTFSALESAAKLSASVALSCISQSDVSVHYVTYNLTAEEGKDYTGVSGTLTIPAGSAGAAIDIPFAEDTIYEGDETFGIALSLPTGATLGTSSATGTITENDIAPKLNFALATVSVPENAGVYTLTVTLSGVSSHDITVNYQTVDQTAKAGQDYTATSGVLTIPAGLTTGSVPVTITNDSLHENAESFQVNLASPAGAVLGSASSATVTLSDNDAAPSVGFDAAVYSASESGLKAVLTIALSQVSGADASISYTTADGTATSGVDYAVASGMVLIPAGSLTANIEIPVVNDELYEEGEAFTVHLASPVGAALGTDSAQVLLTESKPVPAITVLPVSVRESAGEAAVTVSLSHLSSLPVTVKYATGDKTARAGSDYRAISGTLTIPALTSSGTVKVRIFNNDVYEVTETLKVTFSSPSGASIAGDTALITITDNDPKPTPTPVPTSTPAAAITPTPAPTPTLAPTATPTMAPVATVDPGVLYVDVQEEAVATQVAEDTGSGQQVTATVVNVDQALFDRTVAHARDVAEDTGAQVILRFPDITPQEQDTAMRLNLQSDQVLSVAKEGMGVSVKMENVTFAVPGSVLNQAANDTKDVTLECRKAQDDTQPSFRIDLGDGNFLGQAYQYALAVTRDSGETGYVDQFNSPVTITVQLTPEEAAAITDLSKIGMWYVNPVTGKTELLPSMYDPVTMTLTFSTTYFAEASEEGIVP